MDTFAMFDTKYIKPKKKKLTSKEYAKICLNCELKKCFLDKNQTCPIISKYKRIGADENV